ncbi:MAG: HNH endonuclease [Verrucomicrobiota bacterium]
MAKKRIAIPKQTEKRAFQEVGSACGFCRESEIASLQVHHIDEDPSNNDLGNLLVVCSNCHGKISEGVISQSDVMLRKRMVQAGAHTESSKPTRDSVTVNVADSSFQGDVAHTINNISTPKTPRIQHPEGSLGADLERKGYIDYLITRYFDFRKADRSYGRKTPFSHAVIHKNIQKEFGFKTFFMPADRFLELVIYLQNCIDRTALGRNNRAKGKRRYHSFEEHAKRA